MKASAVKGLFAAAAAVVLTVTPLAGWSVTIDVTKFQQRYPWNGLVDIDYTITRSEDDATLDPMKYSVRITVVNCETAVTNVAHVFRQVQLPVSDGAHRVTWDANAENITFKSQNVKVFAEIVHYAEKYMIIDVSGGPNTNCYPVTYLHGAPEGGFNRDEDKNEYKGNKIVLRLIPPGSFVMGSPTTEPGRVGQNYDTSAREVQHVVTITKPFYIGVFEITQKQYENVMGSNPSQYKGANRPVEQVTYEDIRGKTEGAKWPHANSVDEESFMGKLRDKCKEWDSDKQDFAKDIEGLFDLPTEAQWEYACRAGTTTPFNNGKPCAKDGDLDTQLMLLGRYVSNRGTSQHAVVGTYAPNAWGLYDMHGNVWEWCLDWYQVDVQNIENASVNPVGPANGTNRMGRGGSWNDGARSCRSAFRTGPVPSNVSTGYGFRLSRTLP